MVVGEVFVEGVDDPLSVFVGVGVEVLGVAADLVGLVFGVAGEGEPEAGEALAESWGGEEAVDELLVGVGGLVGEEGAGFFGGGGEAGEVVGEAADEDFVWGFGGVGDVALFELGEDELVDGGADPQRVIDG